MLRYIWERAVSSNEILVGRILTCIDMINFDECDLQRCASYLPDSPFKLNYEKVPYIQLRATPDNITKFNANRLADRILYMSN